MKTIKIKSWLTKEVLFSCKAENIKEAVLKAIKEKVYLSYADLRYLSYADLSSNLSYANLNYAKGEFYLNLGAKMKVCK
jgi:hypothetical protein